MNPITASKMLVDEMTDASQLPKADGAFGRRRHSRGLWGFFNPEEMAKASGRRSRRKARAVDAVVKTDDHGQFIGFRVVKKAK